MHPLLLSRGRLGAYLLTWVPAAALLTGLVRLASGQGWLEATVVAVPTAVLFAFICLAPWYLCRAQPLTRTAWPKLVASHLGAAVLSGSLWLFFADTWVVFLEQFPPFSGLGTRFLRLVGPLLGAAVVLYVLVVAVYYLAIAYDQARRSETDALRLEVLAREAELKVLRAQVDPHFLFNALNSISALVTLDPPAARRMCERLADFLRESLRLGERPDVTLGEELALAERYLDIERVRFGGRLGFERAVEGDFDHVPVPPLILQPLVENAVRHGIASLVAGGTVTLAVRRRGASMVVTVANPRDAAAGTRAGSGIGLPNVRARLRARYGSGAALVVRESVDAFAVELEVPLDAAPGT